MSVELSFGKAVKRSELAVQNIYVLFKQLQVFAYTKAN